MEKEIKVTTNTDLERLCRALALPCVFYLFPHEVDLGDQSPADALFWCETKEEAQADIDSRCPPGAWIWEGPAPVATDPAWAVKAMRQAYEIHDVQVAFQTEKECGVVQFKARAISWLNTRHWDELAEEMPASVFAALLQALDARAFGAAKGDPHED